MKHYFLSLIFFLSNVLIYASEINLIIGFNKDLSQETIGFFEDEFDLHRVKFRERLHSGSYFYSGDLDQIIFQLNSDNRVRYAEKNSIKRLNSYQEPYFNKQYYLENTGQTVDGFAATEDIDIDWLEAQNYYDNDLFQKESVIVAVIDSGLTKTKDFEFDQSNLAYNSSESEGIVGVDDDGNGFVDDFLGWNFYDGNNSVQDFDGHGTQVASIIAANADNYGIQGIASDVEILPIKVFGSPGQKYIGITENDGVLQSVLIDALEYATDMGADIINLSLGGDDSSNEEAEIFNIIEGLGILVICAAGNEERDIDVFPTYPAGYNNENIISVASINQNGDLSYFSNWGFENVDIAAPGSNIFTGSIIREDSFYDDFSDSDTSAWTFGSYRDNNSSFSMGFTDYNSLSDGSGFSNYNPNTEIWAETPFIPLEINGIGLLGPDLEILIEYDIEPDKTDSPFWYDYLLIQGSYDGFTWDPYEIGRLRGNSFQKHYYYGYVPETFSLSQFQDYPEIKLRFSFFTDEVYDYVGFDIDSINITGVNNESEILNDYSYTQGTSFSAPIVSGVAAMIMAIKPDLNAIQIKQILMDHATALSSLDGIIASGATVNAYDSISSIYDSINVQLFGSSNMVDWVEYDTVEVYNNYSEYKIIMTNLDLQVMGKNSEGNQVNVFNYYLSEEDQAAVDNLFFKIESD